MDICLIGLDGSGKTTAAMFIEEFLKSEGRSVEYIHTSRARQLVKLFLVQFKNRLIRRDTICDRCYYDFIATLYPKQLLRFNLLNKALIRLILIFLPRFHVGLFFSGPHHVLYSRKSESIEYNYKTRIPVYNIIARCRGLSQIDTTAPLTEVQESIKQMLQQHIEGNR